MSVFFLVFLAIIWGLFGLWGFLRGWKAALLMLIFIIGTLLMLSLAMPQDPEDVRLRQQGRGDDFGQQHAGDPDDAS